MPEVMTAEASHQRALRRLATVMLTCFVLLGFDVAQVMRVGEQYRSKIAADKIVVDEAFAKAFAAVGKMDATSLSSIEGASQILADATPAIKELTRRLEQEEAKLLSQRQGFVLAAWVLGIGGFAALFRIAQKRAHARRSIG